MRHFVNQGIAPGAYEAIRPAVVYTAQGISFLITYFFISYCIPALYPACIARERGALRADGWVAQRSMDVLVHARHARIREPAGVCHQQVGQVT